MSSIFEDDLFVDLEKERNVFSNQVKNLLKISGRKNLLFFIDDIDRGDEKDIETAVKILGEVSSVDGIITIVSLNETYESVIRPDHSIDDKHKFYNELDKFIHVRVRIKEDNHIEYNEKITRQITNSFDSIMDRELDYSYIPYNEQEVGSLFSLNTNYSTIEVCGKNRSGTSGHNLLSMLFLENLKRRSCTFGDYLEELIYDYLYRTKELFPYIMKMLKTKPNKWEPGLYNINFQWTKHDDYPFDNIDWLARFHSNMNGIFIMLCNLIESIDMLVDGYEIIDGIGNLYDLYDYWMINKIPMDGRTWENRKESPVVYSGFDQIETLVFDEDSMKIISKYIENQEFEALRSVLFEKTKEVAMAFYSVTVLSDFMEYFRGVLNNYRLFKMQLRETEILDVIYLDYLISEWQPTKKTIEMYESIKKNNSIINSLNIGFPPLVSFFNTILFNVYILGKSGSTINRKIGVSRIFLYYRGDDPLIIVSYPKDSNKENIYLDSFGKVISDISIKDLSRIKEKQDIIWSV